MGQFIAFDAETDELKEIAQDLKSYYLFMIQAAFPNLILEVEPNLAQYQIAEKPAILAEYGLAATFFIKGDNHQARDEQAVRERIAEEENKYYYAWRENKNEDIKAVGEPKILNKLTRVNALVYHNIVFKLGNEKTTYDKHWKTQIILPTPTVPILIFTYAFAKQEGTNPARYFVVCLNEKAPSFFLDTDEERKFYQYQKPEQSYLKVPTQQPGGLQGQLDKNNLVYDKAWRRVEGLYKYRQFLVQKKEEGVNGIIKTRQLNSVLNSYNTDGAKAEFLKNLTPSQQEAAQGFADNYAKLLPPSFKCFYFRDANNGELRGFLSSVNIGEGRRGSGGYAMRADKVSEVNYLWGYHPSITGEKLQLAFLLSHIIGLEPQFWNNTHLNPNYFPTNWPVAAQVYKVKTPVPKDSNSWFFYVKNFNGPDKNKRRNLPAKPGPPRISGNQSQGYPNKFDTKDNGSALNNRSYRIWKKGNALEGIVLGDGTAKDRASAGSVMASALSDFTFYQLAGFPKSSLSATQFTGQMIQNDLKISSQWQTDNPPSNPILQTDQEWCHLLGHGDGGPEELGNFVAGSKHCNTEQLAIEVGQRRITHNDDIPKDIKGKFTAKITAYLFPNNGAWTDQVLTETELRKKFGLAEQRDEETEGKRKLRENNDSIAEKVFQEKLPLFFEVTDYGFYKLRDLNSVSDSFNVLSDELKKGGVEILSRKILFQFRQNLERHFFQYLPIGRWMRYKIFYKGYKLFDHVYDAQSQSFNYHEAQILDYTLERILYQALERYERTFQLKTENITETLSYWQYYKRKISDRVSTLVPNEEQFVKLGRRERFFYFFQQKQGDNLLAIGKELLKDMTTRPKNTASESVKAKKLIDDFRNYFEDIITSTTEENKLTDESIQKLQSAVSDSEGLYKEIIGQLKLASEYEKLIKTL